MLIEHTARGAAICRRLCRLPYTVHVRDAYDWVDSAERHLNKASEARGPAAALRRLAAEWRFVMAEAAATRIEKYIGPALPPAPAPYTGPPLPPLPRIRVPDEKSEAERERELLYGRGDAEPPRGVIYCRRPPEPPKAGEPITAEDWIRLFARPATEATNPAELVAQAVEEHQAAELVGDPPPAGDAVAELVADVLAGPHDAGQQETAEFPAWTGDTTEGRGESP